MPLRSSPLCLARKYKPNYTGLKETNANTTCRHLLRKSTTFTALDFAPPRKFGDSSDNRSETGSIRSNRSGISAVQQQAIRAGAGRVSRLPGDQVFTAAALQDTLKPQWGFRDK